MGLGVKYGYVRGDVFDWIVDFFPPDVMQTQRVSHFLCRVLQTNILQVTLIL